MDVAFLAMSNHLRITHSTDFFIEILRAFFGQVAVIAHEDAWLEIPKRQWDLIVVFQKHYSPEELEAFGAQRIVLVPMYDDISFDGTYWQKYRSFKILCFSSTMERMFRSFGLQVLGVQYYPELPDSHISWNGLRAFFWQRIAMVDWAMVKRLHSGTDLDHIHIHWTPEGRKSSYLPINDEEAADHRIELSSWFSDPSEYHKCLEDSNVFFAPRISEGIGHSFIEALALGHCVVAADRPTMNEYIQHGHNGLLFDPSSPQPLDFSRAREYGLAARESCVAGRKAWIDCLPSIKRFLEEPAQGYQPRNHPFISINGKGLAYVRKFPGLFRLFRWLRSRGRS